MGKKLGFIFLIALCVFLIACGGGGSSNPVASTPIANYYGEIRGKISGNGDLSSVPVYLVKTDAQITPLASLRANTSLESNGYLVSMTASDGAFLFSHVPEGDYNIIARKSQYKSGIMRNISVNRQTANTSNASDLLLALTETGDIAGLANVPDGFSKAGVIVFVTGTSNAAFTAGDGSYKISGIPVGTYTVAFTANGLQTHSVENIPVGSGQTTQIPLITLSQSSTAVIAGIIWKGSLGNHPASPQINWAYHNSADGKAYIYDGSAWQIMAQNGAPGTNGISITWKGSLAAAPTNPELNWGYYSTADKRSYIYDGSAWQILAQDGLVGAQGPVGPQGAAGIGITWLGSLGAAPSGPSLNNAYYNTTDKKSYIYDGSAWQILAQDGVNGPQGLAGVSVVWKGTRAAEPSSPQLNWAYYNSATKKSYVWDGTSWQIIAQDGSDGVGIIWKGTHAAAPASPQLNWAYYDSADKKSYIYDGDSWEILAESVTGPTGAQGVSIAWQGSASNHPASPQLNWAYHNTTDGNAYIYDGSSWHILVEGREVKKPVISNISFSDHNGQANISWVTNEDSTSQVEYGLTTAYGSITSLDETYTQNHSVVISGVTRRTIYHFRVRSMDVAGNVQISADNTFYIEFGTQQMGSTGRSTKGRATVTDAAGNVFVAGNTTGDLDGNISTGSNDFFVTKFDSEGNKKWTKQMGVAGEATYANSLAIDNTGNLLVAGTTYGGLDGNSLKGNKDFFVVKFDSSGKLWSKQEGSSDGNAEGECLTTDNAGNIFITGHINKALDGNPLTGTTDFFVIKYGNTGNWQWTKLMGATGKQARGLSIASDIAGNIFVTGYTTGDLDGNILTGSDDFFVTKFDNAGNKQWTKQMGVAGEATWGQSIAVDSTGNIFVAGMTCGGLNGNSLTGSADFFVTKFDSSGNAQWTKQMGAAGSTTENTGVTTDSAGNIFVTGFTAGDLDGNTLTGTRDFFVTKFDSAGNKQWTKQMGCAGSITKGRGVSADTTGNIFIAGETNGDLDGNTLSGSTDFFVTSYDTNGNKN